MRREGRGRGIKITGVKNKRERVLIKYLLCESAAAARVARAPRSGISHVRIMLPIIATAPRIYYIYRYDICYSGSMCYQDTWARSSFRIYIHACNIVLRRSHCTLGHFWFYLIHSILISLYHFLKKILIFFSTGQSFWICCSKCELHT